MRKSRIRSVRTSRLALAAAAIAAVPMLAACGSSGSSGGVPTLNFYSPPDSSGANQAAVASCNQQAAGKYKISFQSLPNAADGQRQQLVRRLAAHDPQLAILGMDVTWEAEFSEAGWIVPWTGADKAAVLKDSISGPLKTGMWKGQLVAAPLTSNTQLLWYRSDLVPKPPKTWAQMISMAEALAKQGKPHYIEIQGAQYEGYTVWFNSMLRSAGGSVLTPNSKGVSMGKPAVTALTTMHDLATSTAADPSLSNQMEDQNRLQMEAGNAAFELNYPYVYPSMKADNPKLFKVFKYTKYPEVVAGMPSKPTLGGVDLAIGAYTPYRSQAFAAALCLRNKQNQLRNAIQGGLPPTLQSLYTHPTKNFIKNYPFYKQVYASLENGSSRPQTPAYQNVSIVISHTLSPPASINPQADVASITSQLKDALNSTGLIP